MAKQYRSREGEATAIDTKTQLTTLGSESSPGSLVVPQGVSKLAGVLVAACSNFAAAGSSSAFVRIEGSGLPSGPESIACGAYGGAIATGSHGITKPVYYDFDIPVTPGNELMLYGEMAGADSGQISFGVTLVFA
jgi:hypothetical protein